MIYYSILCIVAGIAFLFLNIQKSRTIKRQLHKREARKKTLYTKDLPVFDYSSILIQESTFLTFMKNVEKNTTIKIIITASIASILFAINFLAEDSISNETILFLIITSLILLIVLPGIIIKKTIERKVRNMMLNLPYFIELTAMTIFTGITIESSIKFVSEQFNIIDNDFSLIMQFALKKSEVSGLYDILNELKRSIDHTEMKMFCDTLRQSLHFGSSLFSDLLALAEDIRNHQITTLDEKMSSLSAKMTVPLVIFIMFPLTVLIIAPSILRMFTDGTFN